MTTYQLPPLPGEEALKVMRKKARKRKIPNIKVGSSGCLPGVGEFKILENGGVVCLEWQMADGEPKRLAFDALSRDPELLEQRLEVDWLIAIFGWSRGAVLVLYPWSQRGDARECTVLRRRREVAALGPGRCRAYDLLRVPPL